MNWVEEDEEKGVNCIKLSGHGGGETEKAADEKKRMKKKRKQTDEIEDEAR